MVSTSPRTSTNSGNPVHHWDGTSRHHARVPTSSGRSLDRGNDFRRPVVMLQRRHMLVEVGRLGGTEEGVNFRAGQAVLGH